MGKRSWFYYVLLPGLTLLGGLLAGLLSMNSRTVYEGLQLPPLAPPGWVFPIVWAVLYVLMGLGMAMVLQQPGDQSGALRIYLLQLIVNYLWPILYFRLEARGFAFFWLLLLILLVVVMILRFDKAGSAAAWLQIPYLLWLIFAAYLNLCTWLLNR